MFKLKKTDQEVNQLVSSQKKNNKKSINKLQSAKQNKNKTRGKAKE